MSWLALVLLGVGVSDLLCSWWHRPRAAGGLAGVGVLVAAVAAGLLTGAVPVVVVLAVAAVVFAWQVTTTAAFGSDRAAGGVRPLTVLGVSIAVLIAVGALAPPVAGVVGGWASSGALPLLDDADPGRVLLVLGLVVVQLSTGNVVVRLVLQVTGTQNPMRRSQHGGGAEPTLKGGRLLGPMERLLILGLGLAGEVTAASLVIAAKGLLRFPELQAARAESPSEPGIHEVTEYFLVGSFLSWSVALVSLVLAVG